NLVEAKGLVGARDFGVEGTLGMRGVVQIGGLGSPVKMEGLKSLVGIE
ncbi:10925_t:CDS:1, partial [Gigaspora rosea]